MDIAGSLRHSCMAKNVLFAWLLKCYGSTTAIKHLNHLRKLSRIENRNRAEENFKDRGRHSDLYL
jgi:hypothetical protein